MKRPLPHPLTWCLFSLGVAAALCLRTEGQAGAKLPHIDKAAHKSYEEAIAGTRVKFDMVAIPGGTFQMGSPAGEPGRSADEGPQHPVTIRPFWMGKTEVTWDEYDLYWKKEEGAVAENLSAQDKAADAVTRPTPPYADETFGHGREG